VGLDHVLQRQFRSVWRERLVSRWTERRRDPDDVSTGPARGHTAAGQRVRFLQDLPRPEFEALLRLAVAVLDPFPTSHAAGALAAMTLGAPVVTAPDLQVRRCQGPARFVLRARSGDVFSLCVYVSVVCIAHVWVVCARLCAIADRRPSA
jgi:hypothetical protein